MTLSALCITKFCLLSSTPGNVPHITSSYIKCREIWYNNLVNNLFVDKLRDNFSATPRNQYIASAFLIFATFAMWEGVNVLVSGSEIADIHLIIGLIGFTLWSALFALSFLLLDPPWLAYIVYIITSIVLLALFGWQQWPIVGVASFLIFTVSARQSVTNERELLASFRLSRFVKKGLSSFFTGVAILLAFVYYFSPYGAANLRPEIPRAVVDLSFIPIDVIAATTIYGYEPGATVGQFQSLMIQNLLPILTHSTGPVQITEDVKKNFSVIKDEKTLGMPLPQFIYEQSNAYLAKFVEPYKSYLPIFFVLTSFLTFKLLSIPFVWFTQLAAWGLMKLFIALGIAGFNKEIIEKDRLVLK